MNSEVKRKALVRFNPWRCRTWWWVMRRVSCAPCWRWTTRWRMALWGTGMTWNTCGTTLLVHRNLTLTHGTARFSSPSLPWIPPKTVRRSLRYAHCPIKCYTGITSLSSEDAGAQSELKSSNYIRVRNIIMFKNKYGLQSCVLYVSRYVERNRIDLFMHSRVCVCAFAFFFILLLAPSVSTYIPCLSTQEAFL